MQKVANHAVLFNFTFVKGDSTNVISAITNDNSASGNDISDSTFVISDSAFVISTITNGKGATAFDISGSTNVISTISNVISAKI